MRNFKDNIIAIDLFCGSGGLTRGLIDAGISVVLGIDIDKSAERTYTVNNSTDFMIGDLSKLRAAQLQSRITNVDPDNQKKLLLAGCAPCQPFSKINRSKEINSDDRLLMRFGYFIDKLKPDFVLSENVPQIRSREVFSRFLKVLKKNGYDFDYGILDAKYYGVPQTRKRLVLIAAKGMKVFLPKPQNEIITVKDAIKHYPKIEAGEKSNKYANHSAARLSPQNLNRISKVPKNGGDTRSLHDSERVACHSKIKGFYDVYGRMSWDKPAPTLTTRCISLSNGRYGHPEQNRAISLREAAALQSFPDEYEFFGNQNTIARHIGNAVPPKLAEHLGRYIRELAEKTM